MNRALLLTDVVDSTALAAQLGEVAAAALWARHDRVARDILAVHGGREIDKTDGFLLLFDDAPAAVAYAVAYHRALRDLGISARAGLHVGPVVLTENAPADVARGAKPLEVEGLAKPVAARVMSVAVGGQTLLTRDALDALGRTSLRVASHGHWRLKGVAEPLELVEVGDDDAPMTPPPDAPKAWRVVVRDGVWLPVREVRHHLPAERDAFVGRASDLRALADLLDGSRLVSVLGIGGTGKTRLVTRFAWTWLGDYPGGAWFCDLSEARSVDGICAAVAQALDVPLGKDDPIVQLGHALAGRGPCLVVLDNFEQVARYAPDTVGRWLDRARDARFVVTTREVLGLPGESALPLAPLAVDDSVALFVARARQAKPDFAVDDEASIRALVTLLDHLPLAIELAAARARVMPPHALLERMSQRFKLLASSGGRHTRQATLRATFDWSWELLTADERSALAQLSVFEGGFTLEAAEAVLSLAELWPADAAQALVDRSWVRTVAAPQGHAVRMDLLVSVQEYAAEKLDASRGRAEVEQRHGARFAAFGDEARAAISRHGGARRLADLALDLDNLVVATRRAAIRGEPAVATATLLAAAEVLSTRGPYGTWLALCADVAALALAPDQRAAVCRSRGKALGHLGRTEESAACYEEALHLALRADDRLGRAHALSGLSCLRILGRPLAEPQARGEEALRLARELGDRALEGTVLGVLGTLHRDAGRTTEALALLEEAVTTLRAVGHRRQEGWVLAELGYLLQALGRVAEARGAFEGALAIHREFGERRGQGVVHAYLAELALPAGDLDGALAHTTAAVAHFRDTGDRGGEGWAAAGVANVLSCRGQLPEAIAASLAALEILRDGGGGLSEGYLLGSLGNLYLQTKRFDEGAAAFRQALDAFRTYENPNGEGWMLGCLGNAALLRGDATEAAVFYEQALAIHRVLGNQKYQAWTLTNLAALHIEQGREHEAMPRLVEAERLVRPLDDHHQLVSTLTTFAHAHAIWGRPEAARAALAEAEALLASSGLEGDTSLVAQVAEARAIVEAH